MGIVAEIAAQKERLFLWAPVAFGGGIAAYFAAHVEPAWWAGVAAAAALVPVTAYAYRRHHDDLAHFIGYIFAVAALLAAIGFALAQGGVARDGTPVLPKAMKYAQLSGTIDHVEKLEGKKGSRAVLSHLVIEEIEAADTPKKVRLTFRKDEGMAAGQRIETLASLDAPSEAVAPGGYDFRRHLFFESIGAVGFAYKPARVIGADDKGGVALLFERLRGGIEARINAVAGPVAAGIMAALITGSRGAIAEEDDEAMRASGLYHLLSISGTHVAMVAGALFFFSRLLMACFPWLALHWPIKKIAAVIALFGAGFYVALAGAEVPAQRALLMTGLVMIAVMLGRSPISLRLIAFSAIVVLAWKPSALIGVSFQMSYAAVAALICFFDYIRVGWNAWYARAGWVRKSLMYLAGIMLTSLIAGTVTGLFSLYHFQSFSVYGVASNMIAVPLTGIVIMPAAIVSLILMPFGMEAPALAVMEWGTLWMLAVAHWAGGLEGASIHVRQWPEATFVCIAAGMILFLLWRGWRGKGLATAIVGAGIVYAAIAPAPDIYVSGSGKLFAVRTEEALYASSGRREKFVAENWQRLAGFDPAQKPKAFRGEGAPMQCDDAACRWSRDGKNISFVFKPGAAREDCGWADVMLAEAPVSAAECSKPGIYDLFDFKDGGAHAFYVGGGEVVVKRVQEEGAPRPWQRKND